MFHMNATFETICFEHQICVELVRLKLVCTYSTVAIAIEVVGG